MGVHAMPIFTRHERHRQFLVRERADCERLQTAMKDGDIVSWYSKTRDNAYGFMVRPNLTDRPQFVPLGEVKSWLEQHSRRF